MGLALIMMGGAALAQNPQQPVEDDGPSVTFGSTTFIPTGLKGAVYLLREGSTTFLPDFEKLKPAGYIYANKLNIPTRQFSEGFPGISGQAEWFAIDYHGRFWVKNPGRYRFSLTSDDGARLYIDGKLVLDNDGTHSATTVTGPVDLTPRMHTIRLSYFQGPKFELALVLSVAAPNDKFRIFNMADYVPDQGQLTEAEAKQLADEERADMLRQQLQEAATEEEKTAVKMLFDSSPQHDFEFRTAVFAFRNDASGSQNAMAFELPVTSLKDTVDARTQEHRLNFFVFATVRDSTGRIVEKFRLDSPYKAADAQFAAMKNTAFTFTRPFRLPPGDYTLDTVVFDREGKTSSMSSIPVERSGGANPVGLSTPVLIQRVQPLKGQADAADPFVQDGKRLTPMLSKTMSAEAKPQLYFVVYPDKANTAKPMLKIAFIVDGKQLAEQSAELPPMDASGAVPLTIGAAAQPGQCELKITVTQGQQAVTRSVRYSVRPPG